MDLSFQKKKSSGGKPQECGLSAPSFPQGKHPHRSYLHGWKAAGGRAEGGERGGSQVHLSSSSLVGTLSPGRRVRRGSCPWGACPLPPSSLREGIGRRHCPGPSSTTVAATAVPVRTAHVTLARHSHKRASEEGKTRVCLHPLRAAWGSSCLVRGLPPPLQAPQPWKWAPGAHQWVRLIHKV